MPVIPLLYEFSDSKDALATRETLAKCKSGGIDRLKRYAENQRMIGLSIG